MQRILSQTCVLFSAIVLQSASSAPAANRPNVLLIYTDDHRYTGVHSMGGDLLGAPAVQTPHIDSLVSDGMTFTNAYLMGAFTGATCIPSRASLLSGRQLFKLRSAGRSIPDDHITIGEAFHESGYHSHIVGKWHQDKRSLTRSFQSGGPIMGLGAYLTDHYRMPLWDWDATGEFSRKEAYLLEFNDVGQITRRPLKSTDQRGPIGTESLGPHSSEVFAENAVRFIEGYERDQPFMMYLAFHAPHDPRQAPEKFRRMYSAESIELPPSYMAQHPFDNGHLVLRDEELAPWPRTPEIARQQLADYYAIISHLDAQIGRVIHSLKESGAYENTLIILAGDSGLAVGCHGLMGKQNVYDEDGIHVPLVISGNLVSDKGRRVDALCYVHDIFPTLCELVGIPTPDSVTGQSLVPVIEGKVEQIRDYTYHAYMQFQRAYRKGDYKLIEYVRAKGSERKKGEFERGSRVTQLFHYTDDPWETFNLAVFPEYSERLNSMRAEMRKVSIELGDTSSQTGETDDFWDFYQ